MSLPRSGGANAPCQRAPRRAEADNKQTLGEMEQKHIVELRERLKPYILRRTKMQVFEELPEKVEVCGH